MKDVRSVILANSNTDLGEYQEFEAGFESRSNDGAWMKEL